MKRGYSRNEIREKLVRNGFGEVVVEFHLKKAEKKKKTNFLAVSLSLVFLVAASFFILNYFSSSKEIMPLLIEADKLCKEGKYDKAMLKYDNVISLNQSSSKGYAFKGYCLFEMGSYNDAIVMFDTALSRTLANEPGYKKPGFLDIYGLALCEVGSYSSGIAKINIAINLNSTNRTYYKSLSKCYQEMGNHELAQHYLNLSE